MSQIDKFVLFCIMMCLSGYVIYGLWKHGRKFVKHVTLQRTGNGVVSWYLYLHRLYCRISVWRSGVTLLCAPCICAYGEVKVGGQTRSSDVSVCTVHLCLRLSQIRRSDKEFRRFFVHRAFVPTVKSKFLCAPCICNYGEFMLVCLIFFNFLVHYNFEIFQ